MAPHIDREAEHIKGKARKDLLALLENVRASTLRNTPGIQAHEHRSEARKMSCSAGTFQLLLASL